MVGLIGISHQTALLEIREQLIISKDEVPGLYKYLNRECQINGILALSTCNRTELYFEAESSQVQNLNEFIAKVTDSYAAYFNKSDSIKQYLYTKTGLDTARHLFRVATGLDSLILGEYQIVSQIKEAFSWVDKTDMIGPKLTRMVHKAFEAGKKVRTRTCINKGAVSVSSAAVELMGKKLGCHSRINSLTIGCGETGTIVAINLSKKGCVNNHVSNRTSDKAAQLAGRINGRAIAFETYADELHDVDVITYTTGSPTALLTKELAEQIMQKRNRRPLMVLDLSNPRNVEAAVAQVDGITLYDLDHMEEVVKSNFEKRKGKLEEAEAIIEEVLKDFESWMNMRKMSSAISSITSTFKNIHTVEARNYIKAKDQDSNKKITEYGDHLSAKFTRMIIKQMRDVTNDGRNPEKVKLIEEFFNFNS